MSNEESERERLKLALHARRTRMFGAVLMKAMIGAENSRYRELVDRLRHDPDLPGVERAFMDLAAARARETGDVETSAAVLRRAGLFPTTLEELRWRVSLQGGERE